MKHPFSELSGEIARLQTELHSARLQEFEAQEQVTQLTTQLEEERALRQKGKINLPYSRGGQNVDRPIFCHRREEN